MGNRGLQMKMRGRHAELEPMLAESIAKDLGSDPGDIRPVLIAASITAAFKSASDRIHGGLWVSFLPQNAEMTREALTHAGEQGIVALKTTFCWAATPTPRDGTMPPVRSRTPASTPPRPTTSSSTSTPAPGATRTSATTFRWSRGTASG